MSIKSITTLIGGKSSTYNVGDIGIVEIEKYTHKGEETFRVHFDDGDYKEFFGDFSFIVNYKPTKGDL